MRPFLPVVLLCLAAAPSLAQTKPKTKSAPEAPKGSGGPDRPSQLPGSAPFVTINGEVVPVSTYVDRLSLTFGPQMREALIEETVVRQEAAKRGIKASPAEVDKVVERVYGDTLRRYGSEENLAKELKATR